MYYVIIAFNVAAVACYSGPTEHTPNEMITCTSLSLAGGFADVSSQSDFGTSPERALKSPSQSSRVSENALVVEYKSDVRPNPRDLF